jgi:hypothetical protein
MSRWGSAHRNDARLGTFLATNGCHFFSRLSRESQLICQPRADADFPSRLLPYLGHMQRISLWCSRLRCSSTIGAHNGTHDGEAILLPALPRICTRAFRPVRLNIVKIVRSVDSRAITHVLTYVIYCQSYPVPGRIGRMNREQVSCGGKAYVDEKIAED